MSTTFTSTRQLHQAEGTFSTVRVKAEVQAEGVTIKKIANGQFFKGETQIGSFQIEENSYLNLSIHNNGFENTADVCSALPLFISDVQTKLNAL